MGFPLVYLLGYEDKDVPTFWSLLQESFGLELPSLPACTASTALCHVLRAKETTTPYGRL